jgi:hypothetical protein
MSGWVSEQAWVTCSKCGLRVSMKAKAGRNRVRRPGGWDHVNCQSGERQAPSLTERRAHRDAVHLAVAREERL